MISVIECTYMYAHANVRTRAIKRGVTIHVLSDRGPHTRMRSLREEDEYITYIYILVML